MGYERKRGKLAALNAFLRHGNAQADFALVVGNTAGLTQVKYVITLDTDTQLPRDAARQLVGAMAHPLNRAGSTNARNGCAPATAFSSRAWPRAWRGSELAMPSLGQRTGTRPVHARGLRCLPGSLPRGLVHRQRDLRRRCLRARAGQDRFPENRILSHDLVEGCYARSGLITDVQLYEVYPARYSADVVRRQRWIRGDWQIALWTLPWVRAPRAGWQKNPLPLLARWKILDNLRRSLVPVADTAAAARLDVASPALAVDTCGARRLLWFLPSSHPSSMSYGSRKTCCSSST
jgi:cyclic beta-1,2-glucan synthetase